MDAVCKTISLHISSVASPGRSLRIIRLTLRIPIGVAAFPDPNRLAQIFVLRLERRALSVLAEGNSLYSIGRRSLESCCVRPMCSISYRAPVHRQIEPAMDRARVTPAWAPAGTAAAISVPVPKISAEVKETAKIPVYIQLMTIVSPSLDVQYAENSISCLCKYDKNRLHLK